MPVCGNFTNHETFSKAMYQESMTAAVKCVEDSMGIREASRLYNLPKGAELTML